MPSGELSITIIHRLARSYRKVTMIGARRGEWVWYKNKPNEGYYPLEPLPFWKWVLAGPRWILRWCAKVTIRNWFYENNIN